VPRAGGCGVIPFLLNHRIYDLTGVDPEESLLRWLRRQGLSGTKEGCGDGDCGACTVALLVPDDKGGCTRQAVMSCLLPLGLLPGRSLETVEALARGDQLHPAQQALVDCAGSQCGYCTPGFVMSLYVGLNEGELNDHTIAGNLCRCTGYRPIREAMVRLQDAPRDEAAVAPTLTDAALGGVVSPLGIARALELKAQQPHARFIAGATDLGVNLSRGQRLPAGLIALDRIEALKLLALDPERVRIGAGVSLSRIERELAGVFPALDEMLRWFASRQVRNRATVGGNLGSASPIGDLLPVLLALDASIELRSVRGTRVLQAHDFFIDYRKTELAPDELILAVEIPRPPDRIDRAYKVSKRQTDDISIVAACFALTRDALSRVEHVRLAYGGVAAIPQRALAVEAFLLGKTLDEATVNAACAQLQTAFVPLTDHRASAAYRRHLCGALFAKFCAELQA